MSRFIFRTTNRSGYLCCVPADAQRRRYAFDGRFFARLLSGVSDNAAELIHAHKPRVLEKTVLIQDKDSRPKHACFFAADTSTLTISKPYQRSPTRIVTPV